MLSVEQAIVFKYLEDAYEYQNVKNPRVPGSMYPKSRHPYMLLELLVMIHRAAYYINIKPIWDDDRYNELEALAIKLCPPDSPVHIVSSSNPKDYTELILQWASMALKTPEVLGSINWRQFQA